MDQYWTPLRTAAFNGDDITISNLLTENIDCIKQSYNALLIAINQNHFTCAEKIIEHTKNTQEITNILLSKTVKGNSPLMKAIFKKNENLTKTILDAAPNNNVSTSMLLDKNRYGATALHAAAAGQPECINIIFDYASDDEIKMAMLLATDFEAMPLIVSAIFGCHKCIITMLHNAPNEQVRKAMLNANTKNGYSALTLAVFKGHINCVQTLLAAGSPLPTNKEALELIQPIIQEYAQITIIPHQIHMAIAHGVAVLRGGLA